ncbi:MAG: response regulator transcription factor [Sphingobacteriia bacterium]|nr:response regulator transcription factor [Sphingobacteriia bacterium]
MKTTIAIADDHKIFVEGIRSVLKEVDWLNWKGEAFTAKEAVRLYKEKQPDVFLLDYYFPDGTGLNVATEILESNPAATIIILSMENDTDLVYQCRQVGIKGYIIKNLSSEELLTAIQETIQGNSVFMWDYEPVVNKQPLENNISKREIEIVGLISKGLTSQEIAETLHLSTYTVNTHRRNILRKLELKNTAMMVQYARSRNW